MKKDPPPHTHQFREDGPIGSCILRAESPHTATRRQKQEAVLDTYRIASVTMTLRTVRDKQVGTGHQGSRKPRAAGRAVAGRGEAVWPDADTTSPAAAPSSRRRRGRGQPATRFSSSSPRCRILPGTTRPMPERGCDARSTTSAGKPAHRQTADPRGGAALFLLPLLSFPNVTRLHSAASQRLLLRGRCGRGQAQTVLGKAVRRGGVRERPPHKVTTTRQSLPRW